MPRNLLVIHLKAGHAQFNRKFDIFGLQIGCFQACSFQDRWLSGTKTPKDEGDANAPARFQSSSQSEAKANY